MFLLRIPLTTRVRIAALVAITGVLLATFLSFAALAFAADRAFASNSIEGLSRAVRLQPWNAQYWNEFGNALLAEGDGVSAVRALKEAVARNPHQGQYWLNLALAYFFVGDDEARRDALRHAVQSDPKTPTIAWAAANMYLVQGDVSEALRQMRTVLENDPEQAQAAFDVSWRGTHDVERILRNAMPPRPDLHLSLIAYLMAHDQPLAADAAWRHLVGLGKPVRPEDVFPYLSILLSRHDVERSRDVWSSLVQLNPSLTAYAPKDNAVSNGGFEEDVLNGGFDWQFRPTPGAELRLDTTEFHAGRASLLVKFNGAVEQAGVLQLIAVAPSTKYDFSAFLKTSELDTPSGPRLQLADGYSGAPISTSEDVIGSTPWHRVAWRFQTPPDTRLIVFRIVRVPGGSVIKGQMWLDDVTLVPDHEDN